MKKLILLSICLVAAMGLSADIDDTPRCQSQQGSEDSIQCLKDSLHQCTLVVAQLSSLVRKQQQETADIHRHSLQVEQTMDSLSTALATMQQDQLRHHRQTIDKLSSFKAISEKMSDDLRLTKRRLTWALLAVASMALLLSLLLGAVHRNYKLLLERNMAPGLPRENTLAQDNMVEPAAPSQGKDHSLALKIADEIVRIENNLNHMDPSVKGYKQLSKAVERIKLNLHANGYEIVNLLGKHYDDGMKITADFVPDDTLAPGEQLITNVIRPLVIYEGKMIQSAQVIVNQNF